MTTETAEPAKVRKELHLVTPVHGERVYVVGQNCDAIEKNGAGYIIHKGSAMFDVGHGKVDHYFQDPRPGYANELAAKAEKEAPSFGKKLDDGSWQCMCGHEAKTLHSLKVHYGKAHSGDR